jgi:Gp157 protein
MTIFEIGDDIRALHDLLTEIDGDVTEFEAEIDKWLAENKANLQNKLNSYGVIISEFSARAKARTEEAARIAALAQFDENQAERLKKRLKLFLESIGETKVETTRYKFAIQRNGGKAPLVVPEEWEREPAKAPERFHRLKVELNRDQIREDLENGEEVEDCAIGERSTHLRIR